MRGTRFDVAGRTARAAALAVVLAAPLGGAAGQVVAAPAPRPASVRPPMPAGTWRLRVSPDAPGTSDGRLEYEEYIHFEGATVTGQFLTRLGFAPGTIECETDSLGQTAFTITVTSATQGTITANGTFQATSMSGTFNWVRDGKTVVYTFTGTPSKPAV